MKQIVLWLSLWLVIVSGAVVRSQERGGGSGYAPGISRRYTVKDEEFSVILPMFPGMMTTKVAWKSDGKLRVKKRLITAFDGVYYSIEAFENPEPKQSLEQFFDELDLTGKYDPGTKRRLTIDSFDGIEYSSDDKPFSRMEQIVATEKHLYRFVVTGPVAQRHAMVEFFSSIKLGKEPNGIDVSESAGDKIYTGREVDVKARLLTKPEPRYTADARKNEISGTVILKVVFAKTGQVQNIRVASGLPYGLTEQAINAAKQIKFTPAMIDGNPVSMWMQLEYNFSPD
jgi:protein TonB